MASIFRISPFRLAAYAGVLLLGGRLARPLFRPTIVRHFDVTGVRLPSRGRRAADYIALERRLEQQNLVRSHAQLRELSAALQTIREEERTHIARELHDDLGQLLAALRVNLALLRQRPPSARNEDAKLMADMDALLLQAITSLRRIASNLRPRALDEGGLYFALESLRQEFVKRHGVAITLEANEENLVLDDTYSTAIYRIVQEALTNIARHAGASKVMLQLRRDGESLQLIIHDNGRGIAEQDMDKASSFGLVGMRERVWALHGDISIVSDGGTLIAISLPLPSSSGTD